MPLKSFRTEHDSLGKKKVPRNAYYGIFSVRASENFPISGRKCKPEFVRALLAIKTASAKSSMELGLLKPKLAKAIMRAGKEAMLGKFENQFIIDEFQAGAGTSTNMNVNEVLANRANELLGGKKGDYKPVHPNNHVNLQQSSNDVTPTAIRIASIWLLDELLAELSSFAKSLDRKAKEFRGIVKAGRTHLMDAVPVLLGQEFRAYSDAIRDNIRDLGLQRKRLVVIPLGGTAVGTGFNCHPKFSRLVVKHLSKITRIKLREAKNKMQYIQFATDFVGFSASLASLAIDLNKIASDLRLLSSGPNTGFGEIRLPAIQPGSSMMPGKLNPSMPEAMNMVCFQVIGNSHAVQFAGMHGELELNAFTPVIAHNLLESLHLLRNSLRVFRRKCIDGIHPNKEECERYFLESRALVTLIAPVIGYDRAAKLAKEAEKRKKSVIELITERGILSKKELKKHLDKSRLTGPNL